jgi:hypothetical protein
MRNMPDVPWDEMPFCPCHSSSDQYCLFCLQKIDYSPILGRYPCHMSRSDPALPVQSIIDVVVIDCRSEGGRYRTYNPGLGISLGSGKTWGDSQDKITIYGYHDHAPLQGRLEAMYVLTQLLPTVPNQSALEVPARPSEGPHGWVADHVLSPCWHRYRPVCCFPPQPQFLIRVLSHRQEFSKPHL